MESLARAAATPLAAPVAAAFGVVAWLRDDKALHPRGVLARGVLRRAGVAEATGVPLLDDAGEDDVVVRLSRSVGLPGGWPDVWGLALRLPAASASSGAADLLLAAAAGRFVLRPAVALSGRLTSVVPFSTPAGPLLVSASLPPGRSLRDEDAVRAALAGPGLSFGLSVAAPRGP